MSSKVNMLLDEYHNEETKARIYNDVKNSIVNWGLDLYVNSSGPLTSKLLETYDALAIIGPRRFRREYDWKVEETRAVMDYVQEGGILLVTPSRADRIYKTVFARELGIDWLGMNSKIVTDFTLHPITSGIFKIHAPWFRANLIPEWTQIARVQLGIRSFPVIAVREFGKGTMIFISSIMLFTKAFMRRFDNAKILLNMFSWIKELSAGKGIKRKVPKEEKMVITEEEKPKIEIKLGPPKKARFCPHCGVEVPQFAVFCPNCGASIEE
ncbi:MAG: zinc ribbon domain-containing protein [Candidatus Freyarchaeota archaeon]|nr:zinc ribbon domain-containing protein [Candidatus Jordarchaeia archaeon]